MVGSDLLRYNYGQKFLCADMETEGLNLIFSRPFQLSYITFTIKNNLESHNYYPYFRDINVSKGAARVTRFNFDEYKNNGGDQKEILQKFNNYLYDSNYIIVAHNWISYDSLIHANWCRLNGFEPDFSYLDRLIDTDAIARAKKKGIPIDRNNLLEFQYKAHNIVERGLKTNLTTLAKEYKIEMDFERAHEGLFDIELNREVFRKIIWGVEI